MTESDLARVWGEGGNEIAAAMRAGLRFLDQRDTGHLLTRVGQRIDEIPAIQPVDKGALTKSYGGGQEGASDDLLVGRGLFYITEQRRLCLDCTAGHYQMVWGYNDPELCRAAAEAVEAGVVWDNHSNIPQTPVKVLAKRLVEMANPAGTKELDTVLLGCCTGSVACAAALKTQLICHSRKRANPEAPVIVVLDGNYHGTDMMAQHMRGMWKGFFTGLLVLAVEPNDEKRLTEVFARYGKRIAGFWAEPIMMNREAIVVEPEYLQLARRLCDEVGALMCIDEIQTGFWQPEVFAYRSLGIEPDLVIAGKGMTAGFHPLAAVIMKSQLDVLAQYDAISTNGSAALPAHVALCCIERILRNARSIVEVGDRYMERLKGLAREFPDVISQARGKRHLGGLKFRKREQAIAFHKRAVAAGLWVRVHAYHEGHGTLLTKLGLGADERVVDFVIEKFRELLRVQ